MEQIAVLGATSPLDLAAAAAGGFALSFGVVALGGAARPVPQEAGAAGGGTGAATLVQIALIGALGLALGALIVAGPWAPLLIAAGVSLLAAPPLHDRLCAAAPTAGARRLAALAPPALALALIVSRLT